MKLAVIICTKNRADELRKTLATIAQVRVPTVFRSADLIVVDNGSSDDTRAAVESSCIPSVEKQYLFEPTAGLSIARNCGLAATDADIIVFTDDDVRVLPSWLEMLTDPLVSGRAEAVAGGVMLAPHLMRDWMTPHLRACMASSELVALYPPIKMIGANMAFARVVLNKVPRFDPMIGAGTQLGFGEDTLFSTMLHEAGYRIVLEEDASVTHHFLPDRLARSAWIQLAIKQGSYAAHERYHWHGITSRFAIVHMSRAKLLLAKWRLRNKHACQQAEGIEVEEYWHLYRLGLWQHNAAVAGQPRRYKHTVPFFQID